MHALFDGMKIYRMLNVEETRMQTKASEMPVHVTIYTCKARGAAQLRVHAKGQTDRTPQTEYIPMPVPKESVLGVMFMSGVRTPQT